MGVHREGRSDPARRLIVLETFSLELPAGGHPILVQASAHGAHPVLLQAAPGGGPFEFLFPMALIFLIFYFLLIRPQQKQQKEHEEMRSSVSRGDQVVTSGGIHGTVTGAEGDVVTVEIANVEGKRIRIKVDRARIDRRETKGDEGSKK